MKWIVILRKNGYALLQNQDDTQYVVASGYNPDAPGDSQWDHGKYYLYKSNKDIKSICLQNALDYFRNRTEDTYITRQRLEELATLLKDGLVEDDYDSAMEYFEYTCDMTPAEKEWLGINQNPDSWKDGSDIGCSGCPSGECSGNCTSCSYRGI